METTPEDFATFKEEAEYWLDKFSLRSWNVVYFHKGNEFKAWIKSDHIGRIASIGLSVDWKDNDTTHKDVSRSAFHEVCELLLAGITIIAEIDICTSDYNDLCEAKHAIIRRLEHSIWLPDYSLRIP